MEVSGIFHKVHGPWCSLTADYDADGRWGYCNEGLPTWGGTGQNAPCWFNYIYNGEEYDQCINEGDHATEDATWCSTTRNWDNDQMWGYCGSPPAGATGKHGSSPEGATGKLGRLNWFALYVNPHGKNCCPNC